MRINQETYDHWSSEPFSDTALVRSWPLQVTDKQDANRTKNLEYLRRKYGLSVEGYEVRGIPTHHKRNRWDSATLLIIKKSDGEVFAKRHNNSQWLSIES